LWQHFLTTGIQPRRTRNSAISRNFTAPSLNASTDEVIHINTYLSYLSSCSIIIRKCLVFIILVFPIFHSASVCGIEHLLRNLTFNLTLGADGFEEGNGVPEMGPGKIIGMAAVVAALSYYWYTTKKNEE